MGRKDSFARVVVLTALAITTVLGAFLLWLAFYGDAHQSEVALKIVYMGLTALGGYGIFSTIRRISKHLFKNDDDDDA